MNQSSFDNKPFWITILLIFSFFAAFVIVIILKPDLFKDIAALWGLWIGTALGYFFGSRPVDELIKKIDTINELTEKHLENLEASQKKYHQAAEDINTSKKMYEEYFKRLQQAAESHKKAVEEIKNIIINYGNTLPQELRERLKSEYGI